MQIARRMYSKSKCCIFSNYPVADDEVATMAEKVYLKNIAIQVSNRKSR